MAMQAGFWTKHILTIAINAANRNATHLANLLTQMYLKNYLTRSNSNLF